MTTEYKSQSDLPNLYNILGLTIDVCEKENCEEIIHNAYITKAKICHPDKHPGRKDVEEVFELLTSAYDILIDKKQRQAYNHKLNLEKQCMVDYDKLKKSATDYSSLFREYKTPSHENLSEFQKKMKEFDAKHGIDMTNEKALTAQDAREKIGKLINARSKQDIEFKPEMLFEEGQFDPAKFNAAFDTLHKQNDDTAIIPNNGPSAWNNFGEEGNYSTLDNFENLYVEDPNKYNISGDTYEGIDFTNAPIKKITKEDMKNIKGATYYKEHSSIEDDYYQTIKKKLGERQSDSNKIQKMKYRDFDCESNNYSIMNQIDMKGDYTLSLDDKIPKQFEKLIASDRRENHNTNNIFSNSQPSKEKKNKKLKSKSKSKIISDSR